MEGYPFSVGVAPNNVNNHVGVYLNNEDVVVLDFVKSNVPIFVIFDVLLQITACPL